MADLFDSLSFKNGLRKLRGLKPIEEPVQPVAIDWKRHFDAAHEAWMLENDLAAWSTARGYPMREIPNDGWIKLGAVPSAAVTTAVLRAIYPLSFEPWTSAVDHARRVIAAYHDAMRAEIERELNRE